MDAFMAAKVFCFILVLTFLQHEANATELCQQGSSCKSLITPTPVLKLSTLTTLLMKNSALQQTTPFASLKTAIQFRSTHAFVISSTIQSTRTESSVASTPSSQVDCSGAVCWNSSQQTTTPPIIRTTSTSETTPSTAGTSNAGASDSTEPVTTARNDKQTDNGDESPTALIAAASVAGVLLILIVILATCFILRRRKRRSKDAEIPSKTSNPPPQKPENQYDSNDPAEAAKLLGTPKDNAYAESRGKDKQESPKVECEYVMVDKSGKKQEKEEGLVYAQPAEFDAGNDDAKVHKPAPNEPTEYADVDQPHVSGETDPDSAQPTYANVQSSPV